MRRYVASGLAADTATTVNHAFFGLWVPSGARRVGVVRITAVKRTSGGSNVPLALRRTTTQGTPGTTITSTAVNDFGRDLASVPGPLLGLSAYSAQPTIAAGDVFAYWASWGEGAGFQWGFESPLWIDGGAGIVVSKSTTGICAEGRISVEWVE